MTLEPFAAAVIPAAGTGSRFGDCAKVLAHIAGRPLLAWVLDAIETSSAVRESVMVTGAHTEAAIRAIIGEGCWSKPVTVVTGGVTRQESVAAGVRAAPADLPVVLVHDGARPLVTSGDFDRCAGAVIASGGAIVAVPVSDTLKRARDGQIAETVDRGDLWAAQTPQGFARDRLLEACAVATRNDREFTDEASIFEYLGWPVAIVPGDRANIKVTHPEDMELAAAMMMVRRRANNGQARP